MKNYKEEFDELKEVSIKLAEMARNYAFQKISTVDLYNDYIKKMLDLGCFSREDAFDNEIFIDDLR